MQYNSIWKYFKKFLAAIPGFRSLALYILSHLFPERFSENFHIEPYLNIKEPVFDENEFNIIKNRIDEIFQQKGVNVKQNDNQSFTEDCFQQYALQQEINVTISVLCYKALDRTILFLKNINPVLKTFKKFSKSVNFILRSNMPNIDEPTLNEIKALIDFHNDQNSGISSRFILSPLNLGYGKGHNANFQEQESDIFVILNDDIQIKDINWIENAINILREQKAGMISDSNSPNTFIECLGNGKNASSKIDIGLNYTEGSVLIIKSKVFKFLGGFDEGYKYAYFEDSDLSLRAQSAGFLINFVPILHEHARGSSSNNIPKQVINSLIEHNRARFLFRWKGPLESGVITNRILLDLTTDAIGDLICSFIAVSNMYHSNSQNIRYDVVLYSNTLKFLFEAIGPRISILEKPPLFYQGFYDQVRSIHDINFSIPFHLVDIISSYFFADSSSEKSFKIASDAIDRLFPTNPFLDTVKAKSYVIVHLEYLRNSWHGRGISAALCLPALELIKTKGFTLVFIGKETGFESEIVENYIKTNAIDLRQKSSITEIFYLIKNSSGFFGIDSGPLHIAQLFKIPAFGLFGATSSLTRIRPNSDSGAYSLSKLECIGCYHYVFQSSYNYCMRENQECSTSIDTECLNKKVLAWLEKRYDWSEEFEIFSRIQKDILKSSSYNPVYPPISNKGSSTEYPDLLWALSDVAKSVRHLSFYSQNFSQLAQENLLLKKSLQYLGLRLNNKA
ncbi:MAG: hypothetical protein HQK55_01980 [Deltaproteobacteria bacterium]|nr:hypothetical protein [Deltaproteobacteria bacterium]